jgi:DNA repair protein RecN (Recombination protein N)
VPAGPLREIASGGELSRVMLALMGAAAEAGARTLVFDEVDAGIGGQTARAVGEQLRELATGRQVICITHLPQIASLADRHFRVEKVPGDPTHTTIEALAEDERNDELRRMLGGEQFISAVQGDA